MIGYDIIYKAIRNITHGQVFDENFLMFVATVGAFVVGEYSEGVAVMLFYQVGELFQSYAVNKSRQSITDLMDMLILKLMESLNRLTLMTLKLEVLL